MVIYTDYRRAGTSIEQNATVIGFMSMTFISLMKDRSFNMTITLYGTVVLYAVDLFTDAQQ